MGIPVFADLERREMSSYQSLHTRDEENTAESQASNTAVALVPAILAVIVFSSIAIFLVVRRRLPSKKPTRYAYSRTSTTSTDPYLNTPRGRIDWAARGYRYDPESSYGLPPREERNPLYRQIGRLNTSDALLTAPRQSSLMKSATSPPPFSPQFPTKHDSLPGYDVQPQAELPVENTPVEKANPYGLPALPSIWPRGWTGQSRSSSMNENGQEVEWDDSSTLGKEKDVLFVTNEGNTVQYDSDARPVPPRIYHNPHSDDEPEDIEELENEIARLIEDNKRAENSSKPSFFNSLPFGLSRSGTNRSRSQAPSRVPSMAHSARASLGHRATSPDHEGSGVEAADSESRVGGFIGRLAAPFSAFGASRRPVYEHVLPDEETPKSAVARPLTMSPGSTSLSSPTEQADFPPTPPAPPVTFRPFTVPSDAPPLMNPNDHAQPYFDPRMALGKSSLGSVPPSARPALETSSPGHARSASTSSTTTIRPLPVLPGSDR